MARPKYYDRTNEEAARIILSDPERYADLPVIWARLWMERRDQQPKPVERKGPVIQAAARAS